MVTLKKQLSFLITILVISSTAQGHILKKKKIAALAAGAAAVKLAALAAPVKAALAPPEVLFEEAAPAPIFYKQAVALPELAFAPPTTAFIGVRESIPSVPAFKAGLISSLETARDGALEIAGNAKEAIVDAAKAAFNAKTAIGRALVLPLRSAASGMIAASRAYSDRRFATPVYRFLPSEALVAHPALAVPPPAVAQTVVAAPTPIIADEIVAHRMPVPTEEIVGPSGYILRYGTAM